MPALRRVETARTSAGGSRRCARTPQGGSLPLQRVGLKTCCRKSSMGRFTAIQKFYNFAMIDCGAMVRSDVEAKLKRRTAWAWPVRPTMLMTERQSPPGGASEIWQRRC
jgi:hypothetical protein